MKPAAGARWAIAALSLVGLAVATYLSVEHVTGGIPACGVSAGCDSVTTSEYAVLMGVPVAIVGVVGYAALLLGTLAYLGLDDPPTGLSYALMGIALLGEGFTLYLVYTQAFRIHAYCEYCLSSAAIMTSILVFTAYATFKARQNSPVVLE